VTSLDDAALEELLGAYALDACEPDEMEAVERFLDRDPRAAAEVARLREAATWVGATEALEAPPALRTAVLTAARARRGPGSSADPVLDLYVAETARFDQLVDELTPADLEAVTVNGLTVGELVIHLAAQETMLAAAVGSPVEGDDVAEAELEARTATFVARFRDRPLGDARALWARAVAAVRQWAREGASGDRVVFFGLPLPPESVLVNRAFETWIHAEDIRRAVERPPAPPPPAHLHLMANLSLRSLPAALRLTGRARPGRSARVVLTGEGGGEWTIPMGEGASTERPDVVVTADIVDWCLVAGERLAPEALPRSVDGDEELAADLLAAAPAFATL